MKAFDAVAMSLKSLVAETAASRTFGDVGLAHCDLLSVIADAATVHLLKLQGVPEKFAM